MCRLFILLNRSNVTMLIHWGRDDNSQSATIDLENYINWYKLAVVSYRSRVSLQQQQQQHQHQHQHQQHHTFSNYTNTNTTTNTTITTTTFSTNNNNNNNNNNNKFNLNTSYKGKRSGIILTAPIELSLPQAHPVETPTAIPITNTPSTEDDNDNDNNRPLFSPEQALALGEVLYVLRPVIYAVMYHQATLKMNSNNDNVDNDDNNNSDDDSNINDGIRRRIKHTLAHVIALSVSLVVEIFSIQLSSLGLLYIQS